MRNRLMALEGASIGPVQATAENNEIESQIATAERAATCLVAWFSVHENSVSVDDAIRPMLAYYSEQEARRLLALSYDEIYRAVDGPMGHAKPANRPPLVPDVERRLGDVRMPGG
jgi:hypothetical protein